MARTSILSCALFLILTSLLFHNLFAAPIFTHPPAQPPTLSPSPAPTPEPGVPPASPPPPPQSSNPAAPPPPPPSTGSGGNGSPGKKKSAELSGGQTAGVVIGVLAALGLLVLGSLVYKKRRNNIRRSRYGSAARRASL
uniref:Uncharacterized protein n=1 Tax=Kalanchoe fedtschenkoi TaxID=63787 RepID=A0A7N0V6P1_KALFE